MDRLEAMRLLREAVDRGSLSAAARALRVPVPTLSRKISELEAMIGTRLLVRTTRSLTMTDAGVAYLAAARRILDDVETAEREAIGEYAEPKGALVLSAPIHFGRHHVLPVVTDFLDQFPEIRVRLLLNDRNLHLVDDHVDVAVRIGRLPDSGFIATRIGSMRFVTAASSAFLTEHGVPAAPEELEGLSVVSVEGPMVEPTWRFDAPGRAARCAVEVRPRLSVTTTEAAIDAAVRGVGVVRLLHYQVHEAVQDGRLDLVLEAFEPEPLPVHLVHATRGQMPLKLRRFIDFAADRLQKRLRGLSATRS